MERTPKLQEGVTRREALRNGVGMLGGLAALLAGIRDSSAEPLKSVFACIEDPPNNAVTRACELNDPDFIEWMRSEPEMRVLAGQLLPHLKRNRAPRFLYPGAGSHVGVLGLATELRDRSSIDTAHFTFTDLDEHEEDSISGLKRMEPKVVEDFDRGLTMLSRIDPNFTYISKGRFPAREKYAEGFRYTFEALYKGMPITIEMLLSCCGNEWFPQDLNATDVFVQHDSTGWPHPNATLFLVHEYFKARGTRPTTKPIPIIMEDLTHSTSHPGDPHKPFRRQADMELFGAISRGTYPYGHRQGSDEIGAAACPNGIVLAPYTELDSLTPEAIEALAEITIVAKNQRQSLETMMVSTQNDTFSPHLTYGELEKSDFIGRFLKHGDTLLKTMQKINPLLAQGLAMRILQAMYCYDLYRVRYLMSLPGADGAAALEQMRTLYAATIGYLAPGDREALKTELTFLEEHLNREMNQQDTNCREWRSEGVTLVLEDGAPEQITPKKWIQCAAPSMDTMMQFVHDNLNARGDAIFEQISKTQ